MSSFSSAKFQWAVLLLLCVLAVCSLYGFKRIAALARDTERKHELDDLEQALYRYLRQYHVYPPREHPFYCARLSSSSARALRAEIEVFLRRDVKYQNPAKPFPADPAFANQAGDYIYWKRSPRAFELYAATELSSSKGAPFFPCAQSNFPYHYRIRSIKREPILRP